MPINLIHSGTRNATIIGTTIFNRSMSGKMHPYIDAVLKQLDQQSPPAGISLPSPGSSSLQRQLITYSFRRSESARVRQCSRVVDNDNWSKSPVNMVILRWLLPQSMSERIDRTLVLDALSMAVGRRNPEPDLIHHSDRGSQYASNDYQKALAKHKMRPSMSRKGDCWDNVVALKTERVHDRLYLSRAEAQRDIFEYIEVFYNRVRLHSTLGYLSPAQFESQSLVKAA